MRGKLPGDLVLDPESFQNCGHKIRTDFGDGGGKPIGVVRMFVMLLDQQTHCCMRGGASGERSAR